MFIRRSSDQKVFEIVALAFHRLVCYSNLSNILHLRNVIFQNDKLLLHVLLGWEHTFKFALQL